MTVAHPAPLPDPWPVPARADFLALVGAGNGLVPVFDALDHAGLWTVLIPEWTAVRNRPQRNAFHHFTVDRHLIEAAVQAAPLTRSVARPEVLVVAALLHDIGKGSPGDHTEAGVELVTTIAARIGLSPADGRLVQDLVRLHLLLPDTATRRDLDDPKTVALVADEVGSVETLDLLAALTEADARATGPTAWTPWRAGLVAALVERVRRELAGDAGAALLEPPIAAAVDVDPSGGATVVGDGTTATVIAPDRRGLFCAVAGVLALHGLDILGATASSRADGIAVEAFRVQPTVDRSPPWDLVQRDLRAALDGTLPLDEQLARRRRVYGDEAAGQAAQPPALDVHFLDHVSDTSTVVDVRGPATLGALYRITRQFAELGLDIRHARVTTVGNQAVDSFYVTDARHQMVSDPETRRRLADAIVRDLAELV
jgi:[protein-PII] uridylyltransferase